MSLVKLSSIYFLLSITVLVLSSDSICDGKNEGSELVTNINPEICARYNLSYDESDCYPKCYKPVTNPCNDKIHKKCPPGWKCSEGKCEIDESSCWSFKYRIQDDRLWRPECLPNGEWKPVQCKGEFGTGRCFCYDSEGKRLFGEEWSDNAKNMTCACSRRRSELIKKGRIDVTLHCDSMGNYEPLQCDSGLCWCAESKTGEVLSTIVTEQTMQFLPCYNKMQIGEQYLRQCESQVFAQAKIREELKSHGTKESSFNFVLCDWDGTYGKFTTYNNMAYCTLKDNTHIGSFATQIPANLEDTVDCNCARDTVLYKEAGLAFKLVCDAKGSYEPVQSTSNGQFYCVDSDGFPTTIPKNQQMVPGDCPNIFK